MLAKSIGLAATVLTLSSLGFSVLGSTPLLILRHDVPMDGRFIRQVFHYCYRVVAVFAITATIAHTASERIGLAVGLGAIALLALAMHQWLLRRLDTLRLTMYEGSGDPLAIRRFRQLHAGAIGLNFAQLVAMISGLTQVTL